MIIKKLLSIFLCCLLITACNDKAWNNPHVANKSNKTIYYTSFSAPPKTLDPARSYSTNEAVFTAQIYEPPLQYHYLKRPYELIPLTAVAVPTPKYFNKDWQELPANAPDSMIAYTVYDITIKPGIFYQPHPAFAKDAQGHYYYHNLQASDLNDIYSLSDFKHTGTRELIAADYVYEIKRLADPKVQSPIFGLMSTYILGLADYSKKLSALYLQAKQQNKPLFINLNQYNLAGAEVLSRYSYRIILNGKNPHFSYWLAMPFFAPIPWEADYFYSQPGMVQKNITFDWYPVGTGPYLLSKNNPNNEIILTKNPNFHGETYPTEGAPGDAAKGYLQDAGKPLPFIDEFNFSLEKENIPRWVKFLQGYYDQSGISSDNFDQTIHIDPNGKPELTPEMQQQKLRLQTTVTPSIFYLGFNMLDDVVGGYSPQAQKLRQAISIAINYEEFISIFLNGRGIVAQSPIPPGIFGYQQGKAGIDPYVYDWVNGTAQRKSLADAKKLLAEAGYPNGRNAKTGQQLILNFDVPDSAGPDQKAQMDWLREQFAKLGIGLEIRATDYNRFQEKMSAGNTQIYFWGWEGDYPDPENFLFLLYGPNGKVKHDGENASNYANPQFDQLYITMKNMQNGPEREAIIQKMLAIADKDAPWVWGFYPKQYVLSQQWVRIGKPNGVANNTLKYARINPELRAEKQQAWNQALLWPLIMVLILLIIILLPVIIHYRRKEHKAITKIDLNL